MYLVQSHQLLYTGVKSDQDLMQDHQVKRQSCRAAFMPYALLSIPSFPFHLASTSSNLKVF